MWQAWEHTLDLALAQLPAMLNNECHYVHSLFFEEQLTAFQVWLDLGIDVALLKVISSIRLSKNFEMRLQLVLIVF